MNMIHKMVVGSAGLAMIAATAAPAAAQYSDPRYGNSGGTVGAIINSVLGGGRYGAYGQGNDRMAVDQCARAAEARVSGDPRYGNRSYGQGAYGQGGYGQGDPRYGQAYGNNGGARVVAVTQVQRSSNGLRVSGLIDTGNGYRGGGYQGQGQGYGDPRYQGQAYPQGGDPRYGGWNNQGYANASQYAELKFNCRVDFRGQITRLNVDRNTMRRGY